MSSTKKEEYSILRSEIEKDKCSVSWDEVYTSCVDLCIVKNAEYL